MSAQERLVSGPTSTEDGMVAPKKYQSSEIVAAATALNFKQKDSKAKKGDDDKCEDEYSDKNIRNAQQMTKGDVEQSWGTSVEQGLSHAGVDKARLEFGYNELTPAPQMHWFLKLLLAIFGGEFNILLWFGSLLCFIAYGAAPTDPANLYLGVVLSVVVTITGCFGYYQESKSSDIMESFKSFESAGVNVIRGGKQEEIPPRELVPGDLLKLKAGDKIPADIRIVACSTDCTVNNSSLTGESDPQERDAFESTEVPLEAKNMTFFGTLMMKGNCKGVVVASGDQTFMGTVAKLAQETEQVETPIALEIKDFVHKVSGIAFAIGISFFIIGMVTKGGLVNNVIFLIGIIVANVPEGLLATVTVSLTLTANRMGQKAVQVKNLESVETLGSTSVICSDKTGTLTTSIMTVSHVYFDLKIKKCDTHKPFNAIKEKEPGTFTQDDHMLPSLQRLVRIGVLCNNAAEIKTKGSRKVAGDATESAVFKFCDGHLMQEWRKDTNSFRGAYKKLHEIPFNSANKWQVSVHRQVAGQFTVGDEKQDFENRPVVVLKGAPEKVLEMCDKYVEFGEVKEITQEVKERIMKDVLDLGGQGERVLGFADLELDPTDYDITQPEPHLVPHPVDEKGESFNGVYVEYEGEQVQIELEEQDKNGQKLKVEDHKFSHVYQKFAEAKGLTEAKVILTFGADMKGLNPKYRLGDLQCKEGSILHAQMGPYKFQGASQEEANWPFAYNGGEGLTFVGLYSMIDPARAGVPEAVKKCQEAGIKVIMVTGDHPVTAHAIAKKVGIIAQNDDGSYHMTKQDIALRDFGSEDQIDQVDINHKDYRASLCPGQQSKHTIKGWTVQEQESRGQKDPQALVHFWNEVLAKESIVFARTSPEQKLKIVEACQLRGGVVAVTGDGVNDSPALKKADIGVAMGITGTEVAKDAADMILKDDNFASIVNGVEEGRIIFDNLKKSIAYTLSSNIPEIAPFLVYQLFAVPLPLNTVMILLVDLGTDLAPAISMAHEGAEADIMQRAPRDQNRDKLVTLRLISFSYLQIGCIQALAGFYAYFVVLWGYGLHPSSLFYIDRDSLFAGAVLDSKGTSGTSSGDILQRDGYWLYCYGTQEPCTYAPDPSVFKCWWDDDVYNDDGTWITATKTCKLDETPRGEEDKKEYYVDFKEWMTSDRDWADLMIDKITEVMGDYATKNPSTKWNTQYLALWKDPANSDEADLYRIYTEFLYMIMPAYTYNPDVVKSRNCHRDSNEVGAPNLTSSDQCDTWNGIDSWKFWMKNNRHCAMLSPCMEDLGGGTFHQGHTETSTDTHGSLFPMQQHDRSSALRQSNTAYFISIIVVQWADLMICKTRSRSLFEQTMTNVFMNYSLFFETALGAFLVYVPAANVVCTTRPLKFIWWTSAIPFSIFIYAYDELRKGWIRKHRGGWVEKNTYW